MADVPGSAGTDPVALRAEHDALAERLQVRRSIDALRTAAYLAFAGLISLGLTLKFAWDRWGLSRVPRPPPKGRYPLLFLVALVVFGILASLAVRAWRRARARRREEERLFARFQELRETLELDR